MCIRDSIAIAVDVSGGITSAQIERVANRLDATLLGRKVDVWSFDTTVHNYERFDSFESGDLNNVVFQSWGGTDANVNWEFMRENQIHPQLLIVVSDGCFPEPMAKNANHAPTLYMIYKEMEQHLFEPGFGAVQFV